jgi:psiF repeat
MQRYTLVASLFLVLPLTHLLSVPALAVTPKQKMETCKFGADHPMLNGKARTDFIKKCMSDKNDPRGATPGTAPPGEHGSQGEQD